MTGDGTGSGCFTMGEVRLHPLSDGFFRLDGGSMFGTVPKPLWEQKKPADERNRILLALNALLVESSAGLMLVEAGLGDKHGPKERDFYGRSTPVTLLESLEERGFSPDDIAIVTVSHLHLDHAGWLTRRDARGRTTPTFPRARHVINKKEWHAALNPDVRSAGSYVRDDFAPLGEQARLELVNDRFSPMQGVELIFTGGHTRGHQIIEVRSSGKACVFPGDLIPTFAHLRLNWIMSWDLFPIDLFEAKKEVLEDACRQGKLLFFAHEDTTPFALLHRKDAGPLELEPVFI